MGRVFLHNTENSFKHVFWSHSICPLCIFLKNIAQIMSYQAYKDKGLILMFQTNVNTVAPLILVKTGMYLRGSPWLPPWGSRSPEFIQSLICTLELSCTWATGHLPPGPQAVWKTILNVLMGIELQPLSVSHSRVLRGNAPAVCSKSPLWSFKVFVSYHPWWKEKTRWSMQFRKCL